MLQPALQEGLQTKGIATNWVGRYWLGVATCTVLPGFIFTGKLLCDL
jgi:hypothetical protein